MDVTASPEFKEGYTAYLRGVHELDNPYWPTNPGSPNYDKGRSWRLGWAEAWLDDK